MSQTTAELVVQEDEYHGTFEIKSYFFGEIRVKIYKDSQELLTLELGDLEDLFPRDKGFRKDSRGLYRITRGECRARFGVSQKVELHAKPLPGADLYIRQSPHRNSIDQENDSRKNSLKDIPSIIAPVTSRRDIFNGTNT
ncbi:unnamed protein product [Rotaria sp. Silwood1]|nr:unnamed protein product [Rotaria sp. Silwood1]CAF4620898.1 unnamed protein product [Rotaria sp. Silwood1]